MSHLNIDAKCIACGADFSYPREHTSSVAPLPTLCAKCRAYDALDKRKRRREAYEQAEAHYERVIKALLVVAIVGIAFAIGSQVGDVHGWWG